MKTIRTLLGLALLSSTAVAAPVPVQGHNARVEPWSDHIIELAESLPIQDGGRIKPLHTFAGFTLLRFNGKRSLTTPQGERITPVEWLLDTLFYPEVSAEYAVFLVQNAEVIEAIGVAQGEKRERDRYTFSELRPGILRLFELAREYAAIEEKDRTTVQHQLFLLANNIDFYVQLFGYMDFARAELPVGAGERLSQLLNGRTEVKFSQVIAHVDELRELYQEIGAHETDAEHQELAAISSIFQSVGELASGTRSMALLPPVPLVEEEWMTPETIFLGELEGRPAYRADVEALGRLERLTEVRGDPAAFESELAALHSEVVERAEARQEYGKVGLELGYYKADTISRSLYLFILGFVFMAAMWLRPRSKLLYSATSVSVLLATILLTVGIVLRCLIRARPPVSTLYETVLFVVAVGAIVALFIEAVNRQRLALSAAAVMGVVGLFIANGYEMLDKRDTMPSLVAVLDTNFWLATHVTAITIGYSAGMLAALLASIYLLVKVAGLRRGDREFFRNLGRMVYGVLSFSLIFSLVGTILGGIWANDSWGRFWGWDPKENGALLICLAQILILHGRIGGYLREHGVCMATAFSGTVIAFSWWGVNLLGVGLHSYGFTSGISRALTIYYVIQWGIVGLGGLALLMERQRMSGKLAGTQASLSADFEGASS